VSDDTTGQSGDPRKPLPKFPWEEGYVAPTAPDAPTERFTPPASPDQPTERFSMPPAQQPPVPLQPFNPIAMPPAAAPPVTDEATKKFDALPSDDPFGPGGMFAAEAFTEHPDDLIPTERVAPAASVAPSSPYGQASPSGQAYPTRANTTRRATTPPPKKSNALTITLISVASVLLVAIIVLVIVLIQSKATPVAAPTSSAPAPSTSAVAEPEPSQEAEEPEAVGPTFASFEAPASAGCTEGVTEMPLEFSWASDDAVRAYIGVNTDDARRDAYDGDLPANYTYTDLIYLCEQESQSYAVTLEDADGEITTQTATVTR
jgi:hypothetical protein